MEDLMFFLITFVSIFIILLINYFVKKKRGTLKKSREFLLLKSKFKLSKKDFDEDKLGLVFVLVNSLIIAVTATITTILSDDYIWQIIIGFALLMILIYLIYGSIGKALVRNRKK
ncbi:MAG: hypothetical protein PHX04_00850 [Bacilli bacterium]|nr:hypothetical protein [Bacilli bacterium]